MVSSNGVTAVVKVLNVGSKAPAVSLIAEDRAVHLDLRIQDPSVHDFFANRPMEEHEVLAQRTIRMGVQVLSYADAVAGADYVDRKFQSVAHDMDTSLQKVREQLGDTIKTAVDPAHPGSYTFQLKTAGEQTEERMRTAVEGVKTGIELKMAGVTEFIRANLDPKLADSYVGQLKTHVDSVKTEMDRLFDPAIDGSYLSLLREEVHDYFGEGGTLADILGAALSLDKEGSPLARLKIDIERKILDLQADIKGQESVRKLREQTTKKGEDFEALCKPVLEEMIVNGDTLDDVRTKPGVLPRGKKGDFIVDVNADERQRIVIETKNEQKLTSRGICDELDEAKRNRRAGFGIFLLASPDLLPKGCERWQLYGDDKIVCVLDEDGRDFRLAYQWARAQLLAKQAETRGVDVATVRKHLKKAAEAVDRLTLLRTRVGTIRNGIEDIDKLARDCHDAASLQLAAIERALDHDVDSSVTAITEV